MAGAAGGDGAGRTAGPVQGQAPAARPGVGSAAMRFRRWHGALAPFVLLPLLLTVSTGLAYRLLRDWGGLGRDPAHFLMALHEGEWLRTWFGPAGETLYVLANALGLLAMIGSGAALLLQRRRKPPAPAGPGKDT
jgi:hypothetical protein